MLCTRAGLPAWGVWALTAWFSAYTMPVDSFVLLFSKPKQGHCPHSKHEDLRLLRVGLRMGAFHPVVEAERLHGGGILGGLWRVGILSAKGRLQKPKEKV